MTQILLIEDGLQLCCLCRSSLQIYASLNLFFFLHRYHLRESVTKLPAKVVFIAQTEPA